MVKWLGHDGADRGDSVLVVKLAILVQNAAAAQLAATHLDFTRCIRLLTGILCKIVEASRRM